MEIKKFFKKITKDLIDKNTNSYEKLFDILLDSGIYEGAVYLAKVLYNKTKRAEFLKMASKILSENLYNPEEALKIEMYDIKITDTHLYQKHKQTLEVLGSNVDSDIVIEHYEDNLSKYIIQYNAIIFMIMYFQQRNDLDSIIEFVEYLEFFQNKINQTIENENSMNLNMLEHKKDFEIKLSQALSSIEHHNDINNFAISLNPKNEAPYINILEDFVEYEHYDKALYFYNNVYAPSFPETNIVSNIIELCWFLSEKYTNVKGFYNAVLYQKKAIELELAMENA